MSFRRFRDLLVFSSSIFRGILVFFVRFRRYVSKAITGARRTLRSIFVHVGNRIRMNREFLRFRRTRRFFILREFPRLHFSTIHLFVGLLRRMRRKQQYNERCLRGRSYLFVNLRENMVVVCGLLSRHVVFGARNGRCLVHSGGPRQRHVMDVYLRSSEHVCSGRGGVIFRFRIKAFFAIGDNLRKVSKSTNGNVRLFRLHHVKDHTVSPQPFFRFLGDSKAGSIIFVVFVDNGRQTPSFPCGEGCHLPPCFRGGPAFWCDSGKRVYRSRDGGLFSSVVGTRKSNPRTFAISFQFLFGTTLSFQSPTSKQCQRRVPPREGESDPYYVPPTKRLRTPILQRPSSTQVHRIHRGKRTRQWGTSSVRVHDNNHWEGCTKAPTR